MPRPNALHAPGVVAVLISCGLAHGRDDRADLVSLLRRTAPKSGVIEAVFASPDGTGEQRIGVDFGTGAWYRATPRRVWGGAEDGTVFSGESGLGRTKVSANVSVFPALGVAEFVPTVWTWFLDSHPEVVIAVSRERSTFVAEVDLPDDDYPNVPNIQLYFNQAGKLERVVRPDFPASRTGEIEYSTESPNWSPLPAKLSDGHVRLLSFDTPQSAAGRFTHARVEAIGAQVLFNDSKLGESGDAAAGGRPPPPPADSPYDKYRWPLFVVGAIFFVGAIAVLTWKRRQ